MPATSSAFPITARLRIGDTLTEGENLVFRGVPSFAPEILRRVKLGDAMKAKKLREACSRWPRRAWCSSSCRMTARRAIVGVVGALQLDVLRRAAAGRIRPAGQFRDQPLRGLPLDERRRSGRARALRARLSGLDMAKDLDGAPVFMAASAFDLRYDQERWPAIHFDDIKDYQVGKAYFLL